MNDQYGWHFVVTFFFHVTFDTSVGCAWCDSLGVARKGGRWLSCGYRLGAARGGGGGGTHADVSGTPLARDIKMSWKILVFFGGIGVESQLKLKKCDSIFLKIQKKVIARTVADPSRTRVKRTDVSRIPFIDVQPWALLTNDEHIYILYKSFFSWFILALLLTLFLSSYRGFKY